MKNNNWHALLQIFRLSGMSLKVFESMKNSLFGLIIIKKGSKLNRPVTNWLHDKQNSVVWSIESFPFEFKTKKS